jgi:hypothetical protein
MMKKIIVLVLVVLVAAGVSSAAVNVPGGLTGFWQFATDATKLKATVGTDLVSVDEASTWFMGPWTTIGTVANPDLYTDRGVVQEQSYGYLQCNPGLSPNGGGSYVNQYTISMDYYQTANYDAYNSLYQTAWDGRDDDGDLFIADDGTIGVGDVGYSANSYNFAAWNRITLSVDNGSFFRVYINGALVLDGTPQDIDGRFSLYPDRVNLFADNDWEDAWGLVGNVMIWDHALTSDEIAAMGSTTTPLVFTPEPATMSLLAIGGLALLRRNRK